MSDLDPQELYKLNSRVKRISIVVFIVVLLLYSAWRVLPDSRFRMNTLGGLTPDQVIEKLGKPDYDSRYDKSNPWSMEREKNGENVRLQFFYEDQERWVGYEYGVEFRDNHVITVRVGVK